MHELQLVHQSYSATYYETSLIGHQKFAKIKIARSYSKMGDLY